MTDGRLTAAVNVTNSAGPPPSAQGGAPPTGHLGLPTQPVSLPGAGQVIVAFLFVSALALGLAALLRRLSPRFAGRPRSAVAESVTILARQPLEPGVNLHIVSVGGERLAVVTSRSGVAVQGLHRDSDSSQTASTGFQS